ncbi:MAG: NAD(P)-dependent oxidoreductase [Desulfobacterales bacterium]|nr:MAG: NAD(P)-dependent oxidoreductase [Desulfobacterales bacterium]
MVDLRNKTIVITGASRGIGRAMALRFARDGANIVVAAKSAEPHPKLKGTIYDVAREVEACGGQGLPCRVDVRFEDQVMAMVETAVKAFGGIDALVNNAGAISLTRVEETPLKRYDLMQSINARAVFLCSQAVLPALKSSANPHILSLCPPLNFDIKWLKNHAPYTLSKYGMTMLSLAMAAEFEPYGIAVNCLWPRTAIATAAIEFAVGSGDLLKNCRKPEIVADAAYEILTTPDRQLSGQALIDEEFLRRRAYTDFDRYAYDPKHAGELLPDFFLEP